MPEEIIGREFNVIHEKDEGVIIDYPDPEFPTQNFFVLDDEFEWINEQTQQTTKTRRIRFLRNAEGCDVELPNSYIGKIFEVARVENEVPIVYIDGRTLGFFREEFEWVTEDEQYCDLHESKLSLDDGDESLTEETTKESSNSLKKYGYKPIINEVSYYEISTFDASYIIHEHLESNVGYEISGVWFDEDSKTFRAIKKKV